MKIFFSFGYIVIIVIKMEIKELNIILSYQLLIRNLCRILYRKFKRKF